MRLDAVLTGFPAPGMYYLCPLLGCITPVELSVSPFDLQIGTFVDLIRLGGSCTWEHRHLNQEQSAQAMSQWTLPIYSPTLGLGKEGRAGRLARPPAHLVGSRCGGTVSRRATVPPRVVILGPGFAIWWTAASVKGRSAVVYRAADCWTTLLGPITTASPPRRDSQGELDTSSGHSFTRPGQQARAYICSDASETVDSVPVKSTA